MPAMPPRPLLALRGAVSTVSKRLRLATALGFVAHLLDPMQALPEEQVRRDRRAQHGHEESQVAAAAFQMRGERRRGDAAPVNVNYEQHHDVTDQRQAEQLEDTGHHVERASHYQNADSSSGDKGPDRGGPCVEQLHAGAHRNEIGSNVESVGDDQNTEQEGDYRVSPAPQAFGRKLTNSLSRR
jgi:hypothetical protein